MGWNDETKWASLLHNAMGWVAQDLHDLLHNYEPERTSLMPTIAGKLHY
jgi:hypothetical protein